MRKKSFVFSCVHHRFTMTTMVTLPRCWRFVVYLEHFATILRSVCIFTFYTFSTSSWPRFLTLLPSSSSRRRNFCRKFFCSSRWCWTRAWPQNRFCRCLFHPSNENPVGYGSSRENILMFTLQTSYANNLSMTELYRHLMRFKVVIHCSIFASKIPHTFVSCRSIPFLGAINSLALASNRKRCTSAYQRWMSYTCYINHLHRLCLIPHTKLIVSLSLFPSPFISNSTEVVLHQTFNLSSPKSMAECQHTIEMIIFSHLIRFFVRYTRSASSHEWSSVSD